MRCRHPMWFGDGRPAGHCAAPAYGPEDFERSSDDEWRNPKIARCPQHGGPTVARFSEKLTHWIIDVCS
jgi:hypothetical protein